MSRKKQRLGTWGTALLAILLFGGISSAVTQVITGEGQSPTVTPSASASVSESPTPSPTTTDTSSPNPRKPPHRNRPSRAVRWYPTNPPHWVCWPH